MNQKILIHYSHVVWPIHPMYDYFFTCDKLMATYKKLTHNLHFLSLFNYNYLLFVTCFFFTLRICWYIKKNSIESCYACVNIARVGMFSQNTQIKGYHISMSMVTIKHSLVYQKIAIHYSHNFEQYTPHITTWFPHVTNGWLHIKNWILIYVSHHLSTITNIC
jgi:hypothetical protein